MTRDDLIEQLAHQLLQRNWTLATAESCTGGGLAKALTEMPGSSAWFECGVVSYANRIKHQLLGVSATLLEEEGAVSRPVVEAMRHGVCRLGDAQLGVAVSGVAGPGGGTPQKPVGLVWMGWGSDQQPHSQAYHFNGSRQQIREAAIDQALHNLLDFLARGG